MRIIFSLCLCLALATDGYAQEVVTDAVIEPSSATMTPATASSTAKSSSISPTAPKVATVPGNHAPEQAIPPFRDPTVPSQKILERLRSGTDLPTYSTAAVGVSQDEPKLPDIIVKAIVLADRDHGVAMLECGGRKLTVRLSRDLLTAKPNGSAGGSLNGFAFQGQTFTIADFSDRSLLLSTGGRTLLIQ